MTDPFTARWHLEQAEQILRLVAAGRRHTRTTRGGTTPPALRLEKQADELARIRRRLDAIETRPAPHVRQTGGEL